MPIAIGDLVAALQLFVVLVLDTQRASDFIDDILIRRRVVAAGSLVTRGVGRFPIGIDIARGQRGARRGVAFEFLPQLVASRLRGRCG